MSAWKGSVQFWSPTKIERQSAGKHAPAGSLDQPNYLPAPTILKTSGRNGLLKVARQ